MLGAMIGAAALAAAMRGGGGRPSSPTRRRNSLSPTNEFPWPTSERERSPPRLSARVREARAVLRRALADEVGERREAVRAALASDVFRGKVQPTSAAVVASIVGREPTYKDYDWDRRTNTLVYSKEFEDKVAAANLALRALKLDKYAPPRISSRGRVHSLGRLKAFFDAVQDRIRGLYGRVTDALVDAAEDLIDARYEVANRRMDQLRVDLARFARRVVPGEAADEYDRTLKTRVQSLAGRSQLPAAEQVRRGIKALRDLDGAWTELSGRYEAFERLRRGIHRVGLTALPTVEELEGMGVRLSPDPRRAAVRVLLAEAARIVPALEGLPLIKKHVATSRT